MELQHLKYFMAAAHFQHITKAANYLHIAQPALSQCIKQLEKELGTTLFDRKSRGIVLNDSGKLLQEKLEPILSEIDALPSILNEHKNEEAVTIHLNLMAASSTVTNLIIAYKSLHPDVKFHLYQDKDKIHDLSITTTSGLEKPGKNSIILLSEEFFLAVPVTSQFSNCTVISLKDTKDCNYVSLTKARPIRNVCDEYCKQAGFYPNFIFESNDPECVRNLIYAGIGIGFWPAYSWGKLHTPQVKLIPIKEPECKRNIILTMSENSKPVVSDFAAFLQNGFFELSTININQQ